MASRALGPYYAYDVNVAPSLVAMMATAPPTSASAKYGSFSTRSGRHPTRSRRSQQEEEAAEHVAPLGDPRDRFGAKRMGAEDKRGERGAPRQWGGAVREPGGDQQAARDEVKDDRVHRVIEHVAQVVTPWVHTAQRVVECRATSRCSGIKWPIKLCVHIQRSCAHPSPRNPGLLRKLMSSS